MFSSITVLYNKTTKLSAGGIVSRSKCRKRWYFELTYVYRKYPFNAMRSKVFIVQQIESRKISSTTVSWKVLEISPTLTEVINARTVTGFYSPFSRSQYVARTPAAAPLWANQLLWNWIQLQTGSLFRGFERLPFLIECNPLNWSVWARLL